ncbi:MAG: hypothetical protein ACI35S_09180 [Anaeroplasma sp.]
MSLRRRIIAATPMICLIIYLSIGFVFNIWHPTWVVFFLIPVMPAILNKHFYRGIYPLTCLTAFFVMGFVWNLWHPGWIVFLTIPVYYTLFDPYLKKKKIEFVEKD